ncbi:MAG: glycosyltransferase family 4 protein [Myxococcota bacterium]
MEVGGEAGPTAPRVVMLLLKFPPAFAGGGLQAATLMERLARIGVPVTTLTCVPEEGPAPRVERAHGGVVRRFPMPVPRRFRTHLLGLRAFLWLWMNRDWDILHIHSYSYFAVLPIWLARWRGRPVLIKTTVLSRDGAFATEGNLIRRWMLGAYRRADLLVALSSALVDDLVERRRVPCRVLMVPNGVDTEIFRPATGEERRHARSQLSIPDDARVIVSCGEINARKNLISVVRAMKRLGDRKVVLLAVGPMGEEQAYHEKLQQEVDRLPGGQEVRLLGSMSQREVASIVRISDVFVLASRAEGLPNSLLEGLASGLPCVATDIPGSADVLADGGGRLVPLDDDARLAETFEDILDDPDCGARLAREGLDLIEKRYTLDVIARRYLDLYRELMAERARG